MNLETRNGKTFFPSEPVREYLEYIRNLEKEIGNTKLSANEERWRGLREKLNERASELLDALGNAFRIHSFDKKNQIFVSYNSPGAENRSYTVRLNTVGGEGLLIEPTVEVYLGDRNKKGRDIALRTIVEGMVAEAPLVHLLRADGILSGEYTLNRAGKDSVNLSPATMIDSFPERAVRIYGLIRDSDPSGKLEDLDYLVRQNNMKMPPVMKDYAKALYAQEILKVLGTEL